MRVHTLLAILGLGVSSLVWAVDTQSQFENNNNWHHEFMPNAPSVTPDQTDTIGAAPVATPGNGSEQYLFESHTGAHHDKVQ